LGSYLRFCGFPSLSYNLAPNLWRVAMNRLSLINIPIHTNLSAQTCRWLRKHLVATNGNKKHSSLDARRKPGYTGLRRLPCVANANDVRKVVLVVKQRLRRSRFATIVVGNMMITRCYRTDTSIRPQTVLHWKIGERNILTR